MLLECRFYYFHCSCQLNPTSSRTRVFYFPLLILLDSFLPWHIPLLLDCHPASWVLEFSTWSNVASLRSSGLLLHCTIPRSSVEALDLRWPIRGDPKIVFFISGRAKIRYPYNFERRDVLGNTPLRRPRTDQEICQGMEGLCNPNPRDGLRVNFDCWSI